MFQERPVPTLLLTLPRTGVSFQGRKLLEALREERADPKCLSFLSHVTHGSTPLCVDFSVNALVEPIKEQSRN